MERVVSYDCANRKKLRKTIDQLLAAARHVAASCFVGAVLLTAGSQAALGQTGPNPFLHLYNQQSGGNYVLSTAPPNGSSSSVQWTVPANATGIVWGPQFAATQLSLQLSANGTVYMQPIWMATTTRITGVYPLGTITLVDSHGNNISCTSSVPAVDLTTTLARTYSSCSLSTPAAATIVAVYYKPGVSISKASRSSFVVQVGVQGTYNGNYDSYVQFPWPAPVLRSIDPVSGPTGTSVTIGGWSFGTYQGNSTLALNGRGITATTWSDTSIVFAVPPGATSGAIYLAVNGQGPLCMAGNCSFTVTSPSIGGLSPSSGITGTAVTISGTNFGGSQGASTITFNGVSGAPTSWSDTSIVVPVPAGATSGSVVVTVNSVASNGYFFSVTNPAINAISPNSAPIGTPVTIAGSNFGPSQGNSIVSFNGITASPTSWNNANIVVPVPTGATSGPVIVTVGIASNSASFTVTPGVTGISPPAATIGTSVTITGTSFGTTQGTSTVAFDGVTATPSSWSNTQIVTAVPSTASSGPVIVKVGGASSPGYTFATIPTLTSVSPTTGGVGSYITLVGTAFGSTRGTSTITFNGTAANPNAWSTASITVPVPSNATTGPVIVTVGGQASNGMPFTFSNAGTISGIVTRSSDGLPVAGIAIQAAQSSGVQGSSTTAADGTYSISNLPPGPYSLYASPPTGSAYSSVTQTGTLVSAAKTTTVNFSLGTPTINTVSPASGTVSSTVTINGSGFGSAAGASTISFNGTAASPIKWSSTAINTTVPAGATTGPVVVTVGGVASNSITFAVGTGSVNGTVQQAGSGTAISGASVELLQANMVKTSATTLSDGTYSLSNLSPGIYDFRFSDTGFGTVITAAQTIGVGIPATVNASLPGPGTISGKVTKSGGTTALQGATITVSQGASNAAIATTDSSGNYSVASLSAGSYTVQASTANYTTQTQNGVAVSAGNTTTTNFTLPGQSMISYAYDSLGRLVGVSDSQSSAAKYAYDAVGNLLSISTNPSSQTSIVGFVPTNGPTGTTVTISGTGFSVTPSQDTVQFNGTAATVTSASATQLIVFVPNGATTGTISVTSPAGAATSSTAFTVSGSNGQPTITNFTPTIGAVGATVSITGTNFDSTPANDVVKMNLSSARPTSATSISLATTVPSGTSSGHVAVGTASGQAVSTSYLYIPPASYSAASVGSTGSVTNGGTAPVTLNTAGQIGLVVFDATLGQHVSANLSSTFNQGYWPVTISILSPLAATLRSNSPELGGNVYLDSTTLPITGTYTALVVPSGSNTGSGTVTVYLFNDITGTLSPCSVPCSGTNISSATPGQNIRLSFSGTAGLRLSAILNSTYNQDYWPVTLSVLTPYGSTLASNSPELGGYAYIDSTAMPVSGTYTLLIDPSGTNVGSGSVVVYFFQDVTGTIAPGTPANITTAVPGQNIRLTFNGTGGQQVGASLNSSYNQGYWPVTLSILNPDGTTLTSNSPELGGNVSVGPVALPTTGTYTVLIDPSGANTGSGTVSVTLQ